MDASRKGEKALSASQYDEAIQHFTEAISTSPTAVKYYINRSTAYQRSGKYSEALQDAEVAVVLAHKRAVRELIKDSQFRRALALFFLGKYVDAAYLLDKVEKLDDKDKMLPIWKAKVANKLKDVPEEDRPKVTIKDVPDVDIPTATAPVSSSKTIASTPVPAAPATSKPVVPTPANKIKVDWYQNNENVVVNILAKGAPKDSVSVDIEEDSFEVSFPISGSTSDYFHSVDPLYALIDPAQSTYRTTPNKIEVTLRKATPGFKWHDLEGDKTLRDTKTSQRPASPKISENAPVYPTSSKTGAKNWDTLVDEDLDDKDEIEGDETSHFFKKLYSGATPEQQRAMMKSYQESGGTVLSTDWSNVGSKTVVPEPPDGMEAKKY